ncbi:hypothetical protein ABIQ69_11420 [Agromyces sp. G08B096]|uniref:Uncharacterized protein n=1 Tax=Agromyces sp. G08B096 TaxID=3156399 RepID=A0AAU7W703_9MICO
MTELFTFDELLNVPETVLPLSRPKRGDEGDWNIRVMTEHPVGLVERVARAIWDADAVTVPWGRDSWRTAAEGHRDDYRRMARGALLAIEHDFDPEFDGCRRCAALPGDGPICDGSPLGIRTREEGD